MWSSPPNRNRGTPTRRTSRWAPWSLASRRTTVPDIWSKSPRGASGCPRLWLSVQHENQHVRNSKPTKSVLAPRPCPWALSLSKLWGCSKVELVTKTVSQSRHGLCDQLGLCDSPHCRSHCDSAFVLCPLLSLSDLCDQLGLSEQQWAPMAGCGSQCHDLHVMKCFMVWNLFWSLAVGLKGMQASSSQIFSHHIDKNWILAFSATSLQQGIAGIPRIAKQGSQHPSNHEAWSTHRRLCWRQYRDCLTENYI